MNYHFSFGRHKGKTFEWVFFNDPGYADWIFDNGIHRQEHNMDELEGDRFRELYRRASHLVSTCSVCGNRPLTRMGLTHHHNTGYLARVDFYCDKCEYQGGTCTEYHRPAFFIDSHYLNRREGRLITSEIKRHFIGAGNLTQPRMEQFFRKDRNFANARPVLIAQPEVAR